MANKVRDHIEYIKAVAGNSQRLFVNESIINNNTTPDYVRYNGSNDAREEFVSRTAVTPDDAQGARSRQKYRKPTSDGS